MKASVLPILVNLFSSLPAVHGFLPRSHRIIPPVAVDFAPSFKNSGQGVFKQYIDHNNTALGTFDQRFWYNSTFWGGSGYPVSEDTRPAKKTVAFVQNTAHSLTRSFSSLLERLELPTMCHSCQIGPVPARWPRKSRLLWS